MKTQVVGILIVTDSFLELGVTISVRMFTLIVLMKMLYGQIAVMGQI